MGLDMYLYGVIDEFNKHEYNIGHERKEIQIGYWRKANQIHNWFVENIQDGIEQHTDPVGQQAYCDTEKQGGRQDIIHDRPPFLCAFPGEGYAGQFFRSRP